MVRAVVLAAGLTLGPSVARAEPPTPAAPQDSATASAREEEARSRFARGVALHDEGELKLALIEFERAYSLVASYKMLFNIGQVCFQLGYYARALRALERYLAEGGTRVPESRRAAVGEDIATIRSRTATLTVEVSEPAAEVTVDGAPFGTDRLRTDVVDAGEHRINVNLANHRPVEKLLTLAGGDRAVERFTLERLASPVAREEPRLAAPARSRAPLWIAWSVTGALAVGAGVTGFFTLRGRDELHDMREELGTLDEDRAKVQSRTQVLAGITDGLAIGALVGGIVATYLTLKEPRKSSHALASPAGIRF